MTASPMSSSSMSASAGAAVRVLFIGGDERQARCDERVRALLCRWYPSVEVRFIHTGWSSNWGKQAVQIARLIQGYDAVVVMRFVRTRLGEYVRRLAGKNRKPWCACTGHGAGAIIGAIVAAAGLAQRSMRAS